MIRPAEWRHWVATSEASAARSARRTVRAGLRLAARARSGSVAEEMDRIVADATSPELGSALSPAWRARARSRRTRGGRS